MRQEVMKGAQTHCPPSISSTKSKAPHHRGYHATTDLLTTTSFPARPKYCWNHLSGGPPALLLVLSLPHAFNIYFPLPVRAPI